GLSAPLGCARRRCLGARGRLLPRSPWGLQRYPGGAPATARRPRDARQPMTGDCNKRDRPLTVLMTADAVGGVWPYAVGLCRSLPDTTFVLATMGPRPSQAQRDEIG